MKSREIEFFKDLKKSDAQQIFLRHKLNLFRKSFSLLISCIFLVGQVWVPSVKAEISYSSEVKILPKSLTLQLPPELARVELFNPHSSGPLLVHIQTAHGNYEAQKKIEAILLHLHRRYGFKLLFLEGSASKFHPELLKLFRDDPRLTLETLNRLAKKALVKAPELYLAQAPETEAYGIEDLDCYVRNGKALRVLLSAGNKLENFLASLESRFWALSGRYLSPELINFIKRRDRFETGKSPALIAWASYLSDSARKVLDLDLSRSESQMEWPMLLRLTKLRELEQGIDVSKLSTEREIFLAKIQPFLAPEVFQEIKGSLSSPFVNSTLPNSNPRLLFERMVSDLPDNLDYNAFPQSKALIAYLILRGEIEGSELLSEMERLEGEIIETLAGTEEERKLLDLYKDLRLLRQLFTLELTPENYEKLKKRRNSLSPFRMVHRFLKFDKASEVNDFSFDSLEKINTLFEQAFNFYGGTQARDGHMLQNIETLMRESGESKAMIVTGGFHQVPFQDYFTRLGYRYALVTPRLTSTEGNNAYVQSILRYSTHETPGFLALKRNDLERHGFSPIQIRMEVRREVLESLVGHARRKDLLHQYLESNYEKEFKPKQIRPENRSQAVVSPPGVLTTSYHESDYGTKIEENALQAIMKDLNRRRQGGEVFGLDEIKPVGKGAYSSVWQQKGDKWVYKYSGKSGWRNEVGDSRNEQEFSEWLNQYGNLAAVTELRANEGDKFLIRQEAGIDLKEAVETAILREDLDLARDFLKAFLRLHQKLLSLGIIVLDGKLDNFLVVERKDGLHVVLNDFHQAVAFDKNGSLMNGVDIFSPGHEVFGSFAAYFLYYFWHLQIRSKYIDGIGSPLLARLFSEEFQKSGVLPEFGEEAMEREIMAKIQDIARTGVIKRRMIWEILQDNLTTVQESLKARITGYSGQFINAYGPVGSVKTLAGLKTVSSGGDGTLDATMDHVSPRVLPPFETATPSKTPDQQSDRNQASRHEVRAFSRRASKELSRKILGGVASYSLNRDKKIEPNQTASALQRNILRGGALGGKTIQWKSSYLATLTRDLKKPLANALIEAKWTEKFYEHPKSFYLLFSLLDELAKATESEEPLVTFIWDQGLGKDPYRIIHEKLQNRTSGLDPLERVVVNQPSFIKRLRKLVRFIDAQDKSTMQKYLEDNKELGIASLASTPQSFSPDVLQFILDGQRVRDGDMPAASSLVVRLIQIATLSHSVGRHSHEISLEISKIIRAFIPGAKQQDAFGRNYFVIAFEEYIESLLTFNQAFEIAA